MLIHGAQSDRGIFARLLPDSGDRFQALVFDQHGSGQSEKPDIASTTGMIADDTAALMDDLDFSPAHVYGVSMGGMIAQEVAIRYGTAVHSLVLDRTTPGGPQAVSLEGEALPQSHSTAPLSTDERGRALAETVFTRDYGERHPELIPALIESRKKHPLDPVGFARRMRAAYAHDACDRLSQIACPTSVITGRDEALIAWENSQLLAEHIADSELVVLEPTGHAFWVDQPARSREAHPRIFAETRARRINYGQQGADKK